jgi:hypothetical protein
MHSAARLVLNVFALLVGVGHAVVIGVYFGGLVSSRTPRYVSNLISSDRVYMNLMTFFVLLQLSVCFGFVRLHASSWRTAVETVFLAIAWVGWLVLILCFGSVSETSQLHFLGVGLFFAGVVLYFIALIYEQYQASNSVVASAVLFSLYLASMVLGALFLVGFFSGWDAAWVFEHLAFMMFAASHVFLFCVDLVCVVEASETRSSNLFSHCRIDRAWLPMPRGDGI